MGGDNRRKATFVAEPLERGPSPGSGEPSARFGNSLRRVLLSSLQGAPCPRSRSRPCCTKFSSLAGVREDAADLAGRVYVDGLNRLTSVGATSITHDVLGNLTHDGTQAFSYNVKDQLKSIGSTSLLWYDPLGRLSHIGNASWSSFNIFDYVGTEAVAENAAWGQILRRYVHGPGIDEPLVWYEGSGTSDRRFLHADERGSIVAVSDSAGNAVGINRYDEYGVPQGPSGSGTLLGRFGYTGQAWLPEAGVYHYKARAYHPRFGRFMQADPIGYQAGMNLYAYVNGDPINFTDPSGTCMATSWDGNTISGAPLYPGPCRGRGSVGFGGGYRFQLDEPLGGSEGGGSLVTGVDLPQNNPCDAPLSSWVGSARAVLETVALGADAATVGLTAGGVTGPIALGAKGFGLLIEGGIGLVNLYDGAANGNWEPLAAQGASLGARVVPGGRALQSGLKAARGPTGILRNNRGQFRSSHLNNPGIEQAGQIATEQGAGALLEGMICR